MKDIGPSDKDPEIMDHCLRSLRSDIDQILYLSGIRHKITLAYNSLIITVLDATPNLSMSYQITSQVATFTQAATA
jgi:hypothetical protein